MPVNLTPTLPGLMCGQRRDAEGMVQPWYTYPALDEIETWDLRGKVVLEWGGGYSTLWWASRCAHVFTIEGDPKWCEFIRDANPQNVTIIDTTPDGRDIRLDVEHYARIPEGCRPDIVCVDDQYRLECIRAALALPRPVTLIVDNWQQDHVFICPTAAALMASYPGRLHVQHDHRDHEGRPWQTAIWDLT